MKPQHLISPTQWKDSLIVTFAILVTTKMCFAVSTVSFGDIWDESDVCECTIDNYLTLISIILGSIGGFFALIQWNSTIKLKRAEFIDKIISIVRFDKEMAQTLYTIDYDLFGYDENFHENRELEYKIDKVLSYFDYICYLYSTKNIGNNDFLSELERECPFMHIINYGIENNIIKKEFISNSEDLFIKYINKKF